MNAKIIQEKKLQENNSNSMKLNNIISTKENSNLNTFQIRKVADIKVNLKGRK